MSADVFSRASSFILSNARLLERRSYDVLFGGADPASVGRAVAAYRNSDGGMGHALEPDLRCAGSQPLFVEVALIALLDAGYQSTEPALSLCDYLERHADRRGLVSPILRDALDAPHAAHWGEHALAPDLNPTASLCGLMYFHGCEHPWLEKATATCLELIRDEPPAEAHTLLCVARLADHHPDARVRDELRAIVSKALPKASFFIPNAPVEEYGLTPLHFAPTPESPWRTIFTDEQVRGHLDDLLQAQQDDGGWPIRWSAPGDGAVAEWRGRWTLDALRTLTAYGVLEAPADTG
jgi:hypothetical protein